MLLPENVLVIYRDGNADSLEFALYYAALHGIDESQLIALPCSGNEILSNYNAFYNEIEGPLLSALSTEYSEYGEEYGLGDYRCLVVGYGVPGGFHNGSDIIATASRLSRIRHAFSAKTDNPLYGRINYQEYTSDDAQQVLITSRIDAPTLEIAKKVVDNGKKILRQSAVNGKFLFDKDTVLGGDADIRYLSDLTEFENFTLPVINLATSKTVHWDNETDVPLFRLINDSIIWAWRSDRAGYTYFAQSKAARVFCYNADTDGAASVRNVNDKRWPMLAMSSGYAVTAGSMSNPTADGYLRPRPFFEAILRGATVGEAFLYAVPQVNGTVTLFGDPLVKFKFPVAANITDTFNETTGLEMMGDHLANSIAYSVNRANRLKSIMDMLSDTDVQIKGQVWPFAQRLYNGYSNKSIPNYNKLATSFLSFPPVPINTALSMNGIKISSLVPIAAQNNLVSAANQYTQGTWKADFDITRSSIAYFNYHFELQLSDDEDFNNIILSAASYNSLTGWKYEKEQNTFQSVPSNGVSASYAGRRVRFIGTISLTRGDIYYVRVRQRNNFFEFTNWVPERVVINT